MLFLWNRHSVRWPRPMPQFNQKSGQLLGIEQSPSRTGTNASPALKDLNPLFRNLRNGCVHVRRFEQHMMYAFAPLVQEFPVSVTRALDRLNQLDLQRTCLHESLSYLNLFLMAPECVFRIGTIRPFNEMKRAKTEDGRENVRRALQIPNHDPNLHGALQR